jgi:hypothetical protein
MLCTVRWLWQVETCGWKLWLKVHFHKLPNWKLLDHILDHLYFHILLHILLWCYFKTWKTLYDQNCVELRWHFSLVREYSLAQVRNTEEQNFAYNVSRNRVSPDFNVSFWDTFFYGNHCGWCSVPGNVGRIRHCGFGVSPHFDYGVRNSWITTFQGNRLVQTAL